MSDLNPLVSVIIPTFNRASTIDRAIKSVLGQTYKNFELIVVDDGSTDNTFELIKSYPINEIIKTKNHGVSSARNQGILLAKGEWIALLDSDDEWLPKKLEWQINKIRNSPSCVCVHGEEIWIRNGVRVNPMKKYKKGEGDQFIPSLGLCSISPSTVLLKKEIFATIGHFREDYPVCEDYDLWLKLTSLYPVEFVSTPLIYKYGGHEDQLSRKFVAMDYYRVKSIDWILQNYKLKPQKYDAAVDILMKKAKVLLNGYNKHNNLENYGEIKAILEKY